MTSNNLHYQTIHQLAAALRSGELTSQTITEALLERIHALNPALNAFRLITEERALTAAKAADMQLRAGHDLGLLHGIPYVTKDLFDVAGLVTTAGSKTLHTVAQKDSTVSRKLAQAGMVLLGKTNTVEFAFGSVGINHSHGTPHNPWQQTHYVPGGSSSGTAVAVAGGLTPFGTGTDTACSVRTPAALCGITGLKSTVGRISRAGVHPLSPTLDSVGPLTRSVADAAIIADALHGPDPDDPITLQATPVDMLSHLRDGVKGMRIGIPEKAFYDDLDSATEKAVRASAKLLTELGAKVDSIDYPEAAQALQIPLSFSQVEGAAINRQRLEQQMDALDPVVGPRMQMAFDIPAPVLANALNEVQRLRLSQQQSWCDVDVMIVPSCMIPAKPVADVDKDFDTYMHYARVYMRNSVVGNLLNLCAVTVPCGFDEAGLPIGLLIYAKPFREDLALRAAYAFEQASDYCQRHPDLDWIASMG